MLLEIVVILVDKRTEGAGILHFQRDLNVPAAVGDEFRLNRGDVSRVSVLLVLVGWVFGSSYGAARPNL